MSKPFNTYTSNPSMQSYNISSAFKGSSESDSNSFLISSLLGGKEDLDENLKMQRTVLDSILLNEIEQDAQDSRVVERMLKSTGSVGKAESKMEDTDDVLENLKKSVSEALEKQRSGKRFTQNDAIKNDAALQLKKYITKEKEKKERKANIAAQQQEQQKRKQKQYEEQIKYTENQDIESSSTASEKIQSTLKQQVIIAMEKQQRKHKSNSKTSSRFQSPSSSSTTTTTTTTTTTSTRVIPTIMKQQAINAMQKQQKRKKVIYDTTKESLNCFRKLADTKQSTFTQALMEYKSSDSHKDYQRLSFRNDYESERANLSRTRIDILNDHPMIPTSKMNTYFNQDKLLTRFPNAYSTSGAHDVILAKRYKSLFKESVTQYKNNDKLNQYIDSYMEKIALDYRTLISKQGNKHKTLVDSLNSECMDNYGRVPKVNVKEYAQTSPYIGTPSYNMDLNVYKDQRIKYSTKLEHIESHEAYVPACHPKSSQFEYLTKCINLIQRNNTICFSIDFEAYEFEQKMVTEIGITIYDPRSQEEFSHVMKKQNFHIIVEEALDFRNHKFIACLKDCYLFNQSCVLKLSEASSLIQSLVDYYLVPTTPEDFGWNRAFVGHNLAGDLKWLQKLGVKLPSSMKHDGVLKSVNHGNNYCNNGSELLLLDTEKLYVSNFGSKSSSLGKILRMANIPHAFLHNAGNDAYYTLDLLMKFCDIGFRKSNGFDDLLEMNERINSWTKIFQDNKKILPMPYLSVPIDILGAQRGAVVKRKHPQTEFGGCLYFDKGYKVLDSYFK